MDQENYNIDMEIEMDSNQYDMTAEEVPNEIVVNNYNALENKPSINDVELIGNKSLEELGIQEKGDYVDKTYLSNENERLRNDIKSIALPGEASGENIHLEDSSDARCDIQIYGNNQQEVRNGYNKVDVSKFTNTTKNGVQISKNVENGSLILNGAATSTFAVSIPFELLPGTIVSYSLNNSQKSSEVGIRFGTASTTIGYLACNILNNKNENFEITEDVTDLQIRIGAGSVLDNFVIYPQVEESSTLHEFEKFGETPTFTNPSSVKAVGDNVKVNIFNKNYLSKIPKKSITAQGITSTFDGEKFICKGIAQTNYFNLFTEKVYKKIGKGIKIFSTNKLKKGRVFIHFYYVDGTEQNYYTSINTNQVSFTLNKDVESYKLNVDSITAGDTIDDNIYVQLEDGRIVTEIEKAENQEYLVDVQQQMLKEDTFIKQNNKWYEKHCWKVETISAITITEPAGTFANFKTNGNIAVDFTRTDLKITSARNDIFCEQLKTQKDSIWNGINYGIQTFVNTNKIVVSIQYKDIEENYGQELTQNNYIQAFRDYVNKHPFKIYYQLAEPILLECTKEQCEILDKIEDEAHTYKNITNISVESSEINPIMKLGYSKDTEKYINDRIASVLAQIQLQMLDAEIEI